MISQEQQNSLKYILECPQYQSMLKNLGLEKQDLMYRKNSIDFKPVEGSTMHENNLFFQLQSSENQQKILKLLNQIQKSYILQDDQPIDSENLSRQVSLQNRMLESQQRFINLNSNNIMSPNQDIIIDTMKNEYQEEAKLDENQVVINIDSPKNNKEIPIQQANFIKEENKRFKDEIQKKKSGYKISKFLNSEQIDILGDQKQLILDIIQHNAIQPEPSFVEHFYSTIHTLILNSEYQDNQRLGQLLGFTVLGFVGFVALGLSVVGIIAGGVIGGILGGFAGKKIKRKIKRKNNLKKIDLFIISATCYFQIIQNQIIKQKNKEVNINEFRYYLQKSLKQFKPVLYYEQMSQNNQKIFKVLIMRFGQVLQNSVGFRGLRLIYKLTKYLLNLQDNQIYQQDIVYLVQNCLKPALKILEISNKNQQHLHQMKQQIKKLVYSYEVLELIELFNIPSNNAAEQQKFLTEIGQDVVLEDIRNLFKGAQMEQIILQKVEGEMNQDSKKKPRLIDYIKATIQKQKSENPNIIFHNDQIRSDLEQHPKIQNISENRSEILDKQKNESKIQSLQNLEENKSQSSIQTKSKKKKNRFSLKPDDRPLTINYKFTIQEYPQKKMFIKLDPIVNQDEPVCSDQISNSIKTPIKTLSYEQISKDQNAFKLNPTQSDKQSIKSAAFSQQSKRNQQKGQILKMNSADSLDINELSPKKNKLRASQSFHDLLPIDGISIKSKKNDKIINDPDINTKMEKLRDYLNEPTKKWETVIDKKEIAIYKKYEPGNPVVILRSESIIENATQKEVFEQIYYQEKRVVWDKVSLDFRTIEKLDEVSDIIYFYIDPGFTIARRDFLQKRSWRIDFPQKGDISILFFSIEHPSYPPKKGYVRAQSIISGYVIEPRGKDTLLKIIACTDVKGFVPKFVVNSIASKAPANWVESMKKGVYNSRK